MHAATVKTTALRFGAIAAIMLAVLTSAGQLIIGPDLENFQLAEIAGYASILLSLSLIFFATRKYRDEVKKGAITFGGALLVGVATDFVAALLYGSFMIVYFEMLNPEMLASYADYYREQISQSGAPASEISAQIAEIDANIDLLLNPWFQALVMFATVFLIGLLVSLISAWVLKSEG